MLELVVIKINDNQFSKTQETKKTTPGKPIQKMLTISFVGENKIGVETLKKDGKYFKVIDLMYVILIKI